MHSRSQKETPTDTLLYERDLLRHCAQTLNGKLTRWTRSSQGCDQAEYYLGIEGFLLHFRNLLGFLINKGWDKTDLMIKHPERWANGVVVEENSYRDLVYRAKEINKRYGSVDVQGKPVDCYRKISWYLQHCTTYRHTTPREWDVERMYDDIAPVLNDFFSRFVPETSPEAAFILGEVDNSTATITKGK